MTQDNGGYDLKPPEKIPDAQPFPPGQPLPGDGTPAPPPPAPPQRPNPPLKPGDAGWVPPAVVIEYADQPEEEADDAVAEEPVADPDIEKHKGMAILGYVFFLIPLLGAPQSKFARFHANQGLLTFITLLSVTIIVSVMYFVKHVVDRMFLGQDLLSNFFGCGLSLLQFGLLVGWVVLVIAGIVNAANGEKKALPVIGHWTLIK